MKVYTDTQQAEAELQAEIVKYLSSESFLKFVRQQQGVTPVQAYMAVFGERGRFVLESDETSKLVFLRALGELHSVGSLEKAVNQANVAAGWKAPGVPAVQAPVPVAKADAGKQVAIVAKPAAPIFIPAAAPAAATFGGPAVGSPVRATNANGPGASTNKQAAAAAPAIGPSGRPLVAPAVAAAPAIGPSGRPLVAPAVAAAAVEKNVGKGVNFAVPDVPLPKVASGGAAIPIVSKPVAAPAAKVVALPAVRPPVVGVPADAPLVPAAKAVSLPYPDGSRSWAIAGVAALGAYFLLKR